MRRHATATWVLLVTLLLALGAQGVAPPRAVADHDDGDLIVTLVDDAGRPVGGACLHLVAADGTVVAKSCDTRQSGDRRPGNGRTAFSEVSAGTYRLRLTSLPIGIDPVDLRDVRVQANTETEETVTITVDAEMPVPTAPAATEPPTAQYGELTVQLRDTRGKRVGGACFQLIDVAKDVAAESCDSRAFGDDSPGNGTTRFDDVPAGDYTLRLSSLPSGIEPVDVRTVRIVGGREQTVSVVLQLTAPGTVTPTPTPTQSAPPRAEADDDDEGPDPPEADQAIVRLQANVDPAAFAARYGFTLLRAIPSQSIYLLGLNAAHIDVDEVAELDADSGTVWAELNYTNQAPEGRPRRYFSSGTHSGPMAADRPAPTALNLDAASCVSGVGVIVAVLDSGFDTGHPALAGRVSGGFDAVAGGSDAADAGDGLDNDGDGLVDEMTGHGTHVAGIIAKVAPGATLVPVKVLDSDGVGNAFYVADGIYYAVDQGTQIINLSLSSTHDARVVREAVAFAAARGVLVVAAAGNENLKQPAEYPASYPGAYSVAASDPTDAKASFSNYNEAVDLTAPGTDIVSAFPGGAYVAWSGTSMATPFVAGTAALLAERLGGSAAGIRSALAAGADPLVYTESNWTKMLGAGRLNIGRSVGCAG